MIAVLGILGGMGPLATADFFRKLASSTPARTDQDHIPTVIYSASQIPDRTSNILGRGPSPADAMRSGVALLQNAGARLIAIPCNTAHYWHSELAKTARVPILNIVDCVCDKLQKTLSPSSGVGLLATTGTIVGQVYQPALERGGFRAILPSKREQELLVMRGIELVKEGRLEGATKLLEEALVNLTDRGASSVILGCTEIPVALEHSSLSDCLIDATAELAQACIRHWRTVISPAGLTADLRRTAGHYATDRVKRG